MSVAQSIVFLTAKVTVRTVFSKDTAECTEIVVVVKKFRVDESAFLDSEILVVTLAFFHEKRNVELHDVVATEIAVFHEVKNLVNDFLKLGILEKLFISDFVFL